MYRFNGGIKGSKVTSVKSTAGYINSLGEARGRHNGGYLGVNRLTDNLDDNVDKTSGIWHLTTGLKFVEDHAVTEVVDNSYWEPQPSEQRFQQTGSTRLGGGYQWNVSYVRTNCPGKSVQWPQGSYGGHSSAGYNNLSRTWTTIGHSNACESWVFDVYGISGYYYTYYPPDVYVEQFDNVTNYYDVWDYF
jgi:hypothetical protein